MNRTSPSMGWDVAHHLFAGAVIGQCLASRAWVPAVIVVAVMLYAWGVRRA